MYELWKLCVENYSSHRVRTKVLTKFSCDLDLWTPKCIGILLSPSWIYVSHYILSDHSRFQMHMVCCRCHLIFRSTSQLHKELCISHHIPGLFHSVACRFQNGANGIPTTCSIEWTSYWPLSRLQLASANPVAALMSRDDILWVQGIPNVKIQWKCLLSA